MAIYPHNDTPDRLQFVLDAANIGTWDLDITHQQVWWDERCKQMYGFQADDIVPYQQVLSYIHPNDTQRVNEAVQWALNPQSGGQYDIRFRTLGTSDGQLRWLHCRGQAFFNEQGIVYRFSGIAQEVTQLIQVNQQLDSSQARYADLVALTPVATAVFTGRDMLIQQVNAPMLTIWGKNTSVIGKTLNQAIPELEGQPFLAQLQHVFDTGKPFRNTESVADLIENGLPKQVWFNHAYNPLYDQGGQIYGVINVAIDVTAQVLARQKIEESELFARMLFERSPIAKAVFVGENMVVRTANQNMLQMWGKDSSVIGKPFIEAMPELLATPQLEQLRQVLRTGEPFYQAEEKFDLNRYGTSYTGYFEYTYEALRSASDTIYGVICTASEVTQQVLARRKVEASEAHLQLLRDTVPAMIFYLDAQQRYQSANKVFREWFGAGDEVIGKTVREFIGEQAYQKTWPYLAKAYGGQQTQYEMQAPSRMNADRWLSIVYTPHINPEGQVVGVIVHATDITNRKQMELTLSTNETRYRALSSDLEQQVQSRTDELAAANQELAATNQELAASNQEYAVLNTQLQEANTDLIRSNQNLEQFAYIASHDLQEPLRKIQQFGDLLKTRFADSVGGEELIYLERMQLAASRMSLLIKDLLAFSRIATSQAVTHPVSLGEVVNMALESLSVAIEESGAQIKVDELPTVQGDELQLGQLFQNLLSNALKFRRTGPAGKLITPQVIVQAKLILHDALPASIKPTRYTTMYHLIEVIDNGIGFEEKYLDRIFQVFQRLHGKNEFAGTGVGLAIVQKVVTNHGGAITASGKPDQGATFCIYLPA